MKNLFFLILIFFSFITQAQQQVLNLASDVWPPFTNSENKKTIALDIVRTALEKMNYNTFYEILEFKDVVNGINSGVFDGSAALWKNKEREQTLLFSNPYLQNQLLLVGLKDSDVSFSSILELENKRVGVVNNYAYDDSLLKATNLELVYSKSDQQNLEKLFENKIDYLLVDSLLIQYLLKFQLNDVQEYLSVSNSAFQVKTLHFAIRKDVPNASKIIDQFNLEIKKMITDGTYQNILDLDWIRVDVDGDGKTELVFNGNNAGTKIPKTAYSVFYEQEETKGYTNYYINGKVYTNWEHIPEIYKKNISIQESLDVQDPGLRINFQ